MNTIYARFLFRWWYILALAAAIAVAATHYALGEQRPLYRAQATIEVGRTIQDKNPEQNEFAIMDRLVPAYAELAKRDPILLATAEALGLPLKPADLRLRLLVTRVPSAPLIDIVVIDSDPGRAAAIANEIARQVVLQSPAASPQDQETQDFIRRQLADLQKKISDGQVEIVAQQNRIATLSSAADIEEARRKLAALESQVESWQSSYARLIGTAEPSKTNLVSIMSQATPPADPIPSRGLLYYALALVVGAGLGTLLALGLNLMKRPLAEPAELAMLGRSIPILTIPRYRVPREGGPVMQAAPSTAAAAAYRLLRNSLAVGVVTAPGVTLAVTSSRIGEGKTTTVANLAVALANAGRKVIVVDANLHNPEIAQYFGVEWRPGLSNILRDGATVAEAIQQTAHPNVAIVAAGAIPVDYGDILSIDRLGNVFAELARAAEVVIVDTPALIEEQDALLPIKHVDAALVVAEAGRAHQQEVQEALTVLAHAGVTVAALVLNKVRPPRFNLAALPWSHDARRRARARWRRGRGATGLVVEQPEA
jgi:capsular exopolysaccharide synthesis family protein